MREPYVEGPATHDDSELCGGAREDAAEAFDRGTDGPAIEPRSPHIQGADAVRPGGRQHTTHRDREMRVALRGRRPRARTKPPCTRTGRSASRPPRRCDASERAAGQTPTMYGLQKSHGLVACAGERD